jgi:hypothetical protein
MDPLLDNLFLLFHSALVLFNLTGWIWRRTRRLHLYTIALTILSWVGLGLFYGWGYCPCTDWHWDVKRRLGETALPNSYVKYYLDRLTGIDWQPSTVDLIVVGSGVGALVLSVWLNWRDWKKRPTSGTTAV